MSNKKVKADGSDAAPKASGNGAGRTTKETKSKAAEKAQVTINKGKG